MVAPYTGVTAWNNAEGGTNGTTVTTGNSGGSSGTAWSGVQITGLSTLTFLSSGALQETMSYQVVGNGGFAILRWDSAVVGTQTTPCGVLYVDYSVLPASAAPFVQAFSDDASTVRAFSIKTLGAGTVRLCDTSDATVATISTPLTASKGGAGWRIEWQIDHTTGAYTVELFDGHSTTRTGFVTGTHPSGGAGFGATGNTKQYKFGRTTSPDWSATVDTVAINTSKLGPATVANTSPTCSAGADVTNATVGASVSLTGTDADTDGTVTTREWTCTARPPGASAPTLTGAATATVSFTPSHQGVYTMSYRVQDNIGAWSTPDTALVYVLGTAIKVIGVTSGTGGAWTDAGDPVTAQSDGSDSTYGQSNATASSPSRRRYRLAPMPVPTAFSLTPRHALSASGSFTSCKVKLYEGVTMRKEWSITPTTTPTTNSALTLTGGEIATVTSWLALDLEYEYTL